MKNKSRWVFMLVAVTLFSTHGFAEDILRFRNRDALHGELEHFSSSKEAGRLVWSHPDAENGEGIPFKLEHVVEIERRIPGPDVDRRHRSRVRLVNGDLLPGDIVSLDDETLVLKTWYAGDISIKRSDVARVIPTPRGSDTVFIGPGKEEDWSFDARKENWFIKSGAWYTASQSIIAKDVEIPEKARLAFKVSWRDQLNLWVGFCTTKPADLLEAEKKAAEEKAEDEKEADGDDEGEEDNDDDDEDEEVNRNWSIHSQMGEGYAMILSEGSISLNRTKKEGGWDPVSHNHQSAQLGAKRSVDVELLIDRMDNNFILVMDGNLVGRWNDITEFETVREGLVFASPNQSPVRLTNISLSAWNGILEPRSIMLTRNRDVVRLVNGADRLSGTLGNISDHKVMITTDYGDLELPLQGIRDISMQDLPPELELGDESAARFSFSSHGRITLTDIDLGEGKVTGIHPSLDATEFSWEAFNFIRLGDQPYDEENWDEKIPF